MASAVTTTPTTDALEAAVTDLRAQIPSISDRPAVVAARAARVKKQQQLDTLEAKLRDDLDSTDELTKARARVDEVTTKPQRELLRIEIRQAERHETEVLDAERTAASQEMWKRYRPMVSALVKALTTAYDLALPVQALDIVVNERFSGSLTSLDRLCPFSLQRAADGRSGFVEWVESLRIAGVLDAE